MTRLRAFLFNTIAFIILWGIVILLSLHSEKTRKIHNQFYNIENTFYKMDVRNNPDSLSYYSHELNLFLAEHLTTTDTAKFYHYLQLDKSYEAIYQGKENATNEYIHHIENYFEKLESRATTISWISLFIAIISYNIINSIINKKRKATELHSKP